MLKETGKKSRLTELKVSGGWQESLILECSLAFNNAIRNIPLDLEVEVFMVDECINAKVHCNLLDRSLYFEKVSVCAKDALYCVNRVKADKYGLNKLVDGGDFNYSGSLIISERSLLKILLAETNS